MCDIGALVQVAKERHALVAVDNTTATAYLQRPLELGVDFAVASDTKALTGHSDVVLGHVATTDAEHATALRGWRTQHGAIPGPWKSGWRTVAGDTASAPWPPVCLRPGTCKLSGHATRCRSRVLSRSTWPSRSCHCKASDARVRHGRELRPRNARAGRDVPSLADAGADDSFGGVHSTAERRARWGGDAISEGFVRFSVGCESPEDIQTDVASALKHAAR